jgi:hypothetical protein
MRIVSRSFGALLLLCMCDYAAAQSLTKWQAVTLAESFIADNGYTNLPPERLKPQLDMESIEWAAMVGDGSQADTRKQILKMRFNSLRPKAIGVRRGEEQGKGQWSVAFDFIDSEARAEKVCRVVTMDLDGTHLRVEHKDGFRKYFVGFNH